MYDHKRFELIKLNLNNPSKDLPCVLTITLIDLISLEPILHRYSPLSAFCIFSICKL